MSQPRHEGTLKKWNDPRGFGFIAVHGDGGPDLFVHITAFPDDGYLPTVGEVLTFDIEPGRDGRPGAVRVQRTGDPASVVAKAGGRARKPRLSKAPGRASSSRSQKVIVLVLLVVLAVFSYSRYAKRVGQIEAAAHRPFSR